jgi:hypothetical protein
VSEGLQGTTTLPGVGKVKTGYVLIGGALVAGIAGYAWWKHQQAAADPTVDSADGGLYADTRTGSELPTDGYTNPAPNADGVSGTDIGGDSVFHAPNTDQEWAQQAIERLSWYEPSYVSAITGKYLARQPLTATEADVIREAWAQIGHPPSNQLIITASTGTGTTTPPATTPTMKAPTGLRATKVSSTAVDLDWTPVSGAKGYKILVNGNQNGNAVLYSAGAARYLKSNTSYTIGVAGIFAGDKVGPVASIHVKTSK